MIYEFHPEAQAEHLESIAYYETRRAGLGASHLAEFESILERTDEAPTRFPIERTPDIRRIALSRFPFTVLSRESEGRVQI